MIRGYSVKKRGSRLCKDGVVNKEGEGEQTE